MEDLREQSPNNIYMKWHEKGMMKQQKINNKKTKGLKKSDLKDLNPEVEIEDSESESEDEDFEFLEYLDSHKNSDLTEELSANGNYFICYDISQNKITGYFKQQFLKNCQKMILESKALGQMGNIFPSCDKI